MKSSIFSLFAGLAMLIASVWLDNFEKYAFFLLGVAIVGALWDIERAIKEAGR